MPPSDTRGLRQHEQDALRRRGIAMVRAGATQRAVATELGVRPATVCAWMQRATRSLDEAARSRRRGPRTYPHRKLKPWQDKRIARHLANRSPLELRLPYALWTRQAVADLIEQTYGVALSRWSVVQHLRRWGFIPESTAPSARYLLSADASPGIAEMLSDLRRQARLEHAMIWFQDQIGKNTDAYDVLYATTACGDYAFAAYAGELTPAIFLSFVQRLCENAKRKVYLVVGGHGLHRRRPLVYWAQANPHRIRFIVRPDPAHPGPDGGRAPRRR